MLSISPVTEILYVNQEVIQKIKWQKLANSNTMSTIKWNSEITKESIRPLLNSIQNRKSRKAFKKEEVFAKVWKDA